MPLLRLGLLLMLIGLRQPQERNLDELTGAVIWIFRPVIRW
jgi:hypothetical protein